MEIVMDYQQITADTGEVQSFVDQLNQLGDVTAKSLTI